MKSYLLMISCAMLQSNVFAGNVIVNGSFEQPPQVGTTLQLINESLVPGWETNASDSLIEIWSQSFQNVTSDTGLQHAELNATEVSTLFQDVSGIPANVTVGYGFSHRGRSGLDTLELKIIDLGTDNSSGGIGTNADTTLFSQQFSSPSGLWTHYSSPNIGSLTQGNMMRFEFESISAAGGTQSIGNFLDSVQFGVGVPEPTSVSLLLASLSSLLIRRQ